MNVSLGGSVRSEPVYTGGVFFVGETDGAVQALNGDGRSLWSFGGDGGFSDSALIPAVQKTQEVIAVSDQGTAYAVDACTGSMIWSTPTGQSGTPTTPAILTSVTNSTATNQPLAFVGFSGGGLVALNAVTGALVWQKNVGPVGAPPAAYGSGRSARVVIAADGAGDVYSLNPGTGQVNWGDTNPGSVQGPPAIANGLVYLTIGPNSAAPGELVAVRADTGGGVLVSDALNPQPYPPGPPSIGDGRVFVGDFNASLSIFELPAGGPPPRGGKSAGR